MGTILSLFTFYCHWNIFRWWEKDDPPSLSWLKKWLQWRRCSVSVIISTPDEESLRTWRRVSPGEAASWWRWLPLTWVNQLDGACVCVAVAFVNSVGCNSVLNASLSAIDTPVPRRPHSSCPHVETVSQSPVVEPLWTVTRSLWHKAIRFFFQKHLSWLIYSTSSLLTVSGALGVISCHWCHLSINYINSHYLNPAKRHTDTRLNTAGYL